MKCWTSEKQINPTIALSDFLEKISAAELEGGTQAKPHSLHELRGWKWKPRYTEEGRIYRAEEGKRKMLREKPLEICKVFL